MKKQETEKKELDSELTNDEILITYRNAAIYDEFLFGDYDYAKEWLNDNQH